MFNVQCSVFDVQCVMCDVGCSMWDAEESRLEAEKKDYSHPCCSYETFLGFEVSLYKC